MKTHIGHYEIVAILGRGGMGVVYKGYEPALARFVAIKELAPALAHDTSLVERFLREARSMAALNDPHILQIHFIGEDNGQPFFAMEFVDGESLSSVIKRERRLHVGDALKVLLQAAQGVAVAHDRGVIHRDIKPANLLLTQRGQVKIADFGIALASQEFDSKLTGTGQLVGTPGYLSPEVCLGKPVDARSDIFALGIVLFEMLTGHTPFSDESPLKLMLDVVQSEIPDVRGLNEEVDADVAAMLARMLAKDPAARYQTVHGLIADLQKNPLAIQAGALSFKVEPVVSSAATQMLPATPGGARPPTPLPGAVATPHSSTRPGTPAPAPAPVAAAPVAAKSRWPLWAALAALLIVGTVFAWRAFLVPKPEPPAVAATPAQAVAPAPAPAPVPAVTPALATPTTIATPLAADAAPPPPSPPAVASTTPAEKPKPKAAPKPVAEEAPAEEEEPASEPVFVQVPTLGGAYRNPSAQDNRHPFQGVRTGTRRVAIVSGGDPTLSDSAARLVEQQLRSAGATIVDDPAEADIVVRVNANVLGGGSSAFSSAMLSVQAFGAGGRALGPGVSQRIQYSDEDVDGKLSQLMRGSSGRISDFLKH